jgi:SAM-dependent methyltransferase
VERCSELEIMESQALPDDVIARTHRDLDRIHRLLGDTRLLLAELRRDPQPVRRVLDIGCGAGGVMGQVRRRLGVDVVGVDLCPPRCVPEGLKVIQADAVRDALPEADVAYSMMVAHHLSEQDLIGLIRNVGRSCRRFILLDLVRHRLPLALFEMFVVPFVNHVSAADGRVSIRRAYTPGELRAVVESALAGTGAQFSQTVSPIRARQVVQILYKPATR